MYSPSFLRSWKPTIFRETILRRRSLLPKAIRALSRDPRITKRIIKSIAPSIYGHEEIKTAHALSLFGGVEKEYQSASQKRGYQCFDVG
jgi:DNA replicative helicase MCM subunit Mcm2 (Cdc46/Mcm family)